MQIFQNIYYKEQMEMEAACQLTAFAKRELGLTPVDAYARIRDDVLTLTLPQALTPMGRIIAQDTQGAESLRCVYAILCKANRPAMEAIVSRILGAPARCRQMEMDLTSANITLVFQLTMASRRQMRNG